MHWVNIDNMSIVASVPRSRAPKKKHQQRETQSGTDIARLWSCQYRPAALRPVDSSARRPDVHTVFIYYIYYYQAASLLAFFGRVSVWLLCNDSILCRLNCFTVKLTMLALVFRFWLLFDCCSAHKQRSELYANKRKNTFETEKCIRKFTHKCAR